MPRLGSKKSRKGCRRCRQRRVKCDEKGPCGNCIRRHEECSLLETALSAKATSVSPEPRRSLSFNSLEDEWMEDMQLMYHYTMNVSMEGLEISQARQSVWREYIPTQALKYPFLLHGILALSALNLAYLDREESTKYLRLFDKHQAVALAKFRTTLSVEIDTEMANALFALAATLSASSTARSCALPEVMANPGFMDMNDVAELFYLTRGVRDIVKATNDNVWKGPMVVLLYYDFAYPDGIESSLPQSVVNQFGSLHEMIADYGLDREALNHCQTALHALEDIYRNIQYRAVVADVQMGHIWQWQVKVSTGYIKLIQARSPPALVILAYYAAAMSAIPQTWFLQNWARFSISGIGFELSESMQHWIDWPAQQVQEGLAILGVTASKTEHKPERQFIGF